MKRIEGRSTTAAGGLKPYQTAVLALLNHAKPATILDAPSGTGWLGAGLAYPAQVDGIDLMAPRPAGYRGFVAGDLDDGIPGDLGRYDAIVCCEGVEHVGNPLLLLRSAVRHLAPGGLLLVSTPNVWYPAARLQYLLRGFLPGFPCLAGKVVPGTHMHLVPWSFGQLHLFLRLAGADAVALHALDEPKPKRAYEHLFDWPFSAYCRSRRARAACDEERAFWSHAGSPQARLGRRLLVSARAGTAASAGR